MIKRIYRFSLLIIFIIFCSLLYITTTDLYREYIARESAVVEYVPKNAYSLEENGSQDQVLPATLAEDVHMVIPSGEPIGIYVKTEGVMVINTSKFENNQGNVSYPGKDLFRSGDYIVGIDGVKIQDKRSLTDIVEKSQGNVLKVDIIRDGVLKSVDIKPEKNKDGSYMLGLWVKDDISGIGTLTYIDEEGFGALGHSINDNDTGSVFDISDGAIYETTIVNIVKSDGKNPGRLEGMIDYSRENILGRVEENREYGINGYVTKKGAKDLATGEWMPIGTKAEVQLGDAYILSCLSGEPRYYKIKITDIDVSESAGNKGLELQIVDENLLNLTNGIVQGMSGTPIIQNGKLIGAVTHVFVKDSTRGYGIFIENMLEH